MTTAAAYVHLARALVDAYVEYVTDRLDTEATIGFTIAVVLVALRWWE